MNALTSWDATWSEIRAFAAELVEISEAEIEVWSSHALQIPCDCRCITCQKHTLYTHICEALERWEKRQQS